MITGFNTDVKFGETTYHVQTEDKGESNPLIESLVYMGGQILESFRTSYQEYLNSGDFKELTLHKILESQHRQLVMAIRRGQFEKGIELENYVEGDFVFRFSSSRAATLPKPKSPALSAAPPEIGHSTSVPLKPFAGKGSPRPATKVEPEETPVSRVTQYSKPSQRSESKETGQAGTSGLSLESLDLSSDNQQGIEIHVEGSKAFVAGSHVDLNLSVQSRGLGTKLENVQVVIKVIGTAFSPRLYAGKTDRNGDLKISFNLPNYTVGSAALIIQALTSLGADEVKYLIRRK